MQVLKTEITNTIGISICIDGDWIKVGQTINAHAKGYPDKNEIEQFIRESMGNAMEGCAEQTQLLVDKLNKDMGAK